MGLKRFCAKTARLPAFFISKLGLILFFLNRKSPKKNKGITKMIILRKNIFRTAMLISLTIVTLVYGVTYSIDIEGANVYSEEINIDKHVEDINTLIISENSNQICDSSTGVCTPPAGWYSTNN